jgi:hypothetical protein
MVKKSIINQYLSSGKRLMPLNGKRPIKDNWPEILYTNEQLFSWQNNLAWIPSEKDLIIDIDPRNHGEESWKKFKRDLNIEDDINLEPVVKTPGGGYHIYLKIPESHQHLSFKKTFKGKYDGVDFLTKGSYCLIPSCYTKKEDNKGLYEGLYVWADDLFGKFEQKDTPTAILNYISYSKTDKEDLGDFAGLIGGESATWPEEKVLEMLEKLDPSMPNDDWVKVGMALHDWDPIKGEELWENWSQDGDNYDEGETKKRWKSFDISGGVTLGTISYMAKEVDYDNLSSKVSRILDKIKYASEKDLEFGLVQEIRKLNLPKLQLEKIAKGIKDRYKQITGAPLPISDIRNMVYGYELVNGQFIEEGEQPDWCKEWVYVNSHTAFANLNTLKILKTEAFNIKNGKWVPESVNGSKQSAAKYVADKGFVETVDSMAYLPNTNEPICVIDDFKVLNSFNSKTVPLSAESFTKEGLEAIELVKKHIKFICTTDINSDLFTQWLAHQVQFPGKQILWSPVIQSIQGVGKSFFGELLRACLGDRNVGTVSPTQVVSDFNGWATNVMVNVLEELRVKGHNRYDAVNSLKPLVTDRMIQINDKGVKQYMTYNTTNYICFTNYKDSLPLDQDDRRWWVIFVPIEKLEDLSDYVGESSLTYFPKLFNAVRTYGNEIRKWLLDYKLSDEFLAIKQAPMTDHKLSMIATEEAAFEGYSELKELIEKGGEYYNKDVISSSDLFDALMFEYPELDIKTSKRHLLLKKLGYNILPNKIKIDGKSKRVWSKKLIDNEEVRKLLS